MSEPTTTLSEGNEALRQGAIDQWEFIRRCTMRMHYDHVRRMGTMATAAPAPTR